MSVTTSGGGSTSGKVFVPPTLENYDYDLDGNLTSDGRWTYVWDAENRLIQMTPLAGTPDADARRLKFAYDHQGRRIWKRVDYMVGGNWAPYYERKFLYDGWNLIAELWPNDVVLKKFMWGLDLSGTEQGAGGVGGLLKVWYYYTSDHFFAGYDGNGNVTLLTASGDGTAAARYEYGPFGEPIRASGSSLIAASDYRGNPFRFSTNYTDPESDLLYYGHRYYNPSTGRWISRDPIEENGGINLYAYVENNSLGAIDPVGQQRFTIWAAAFIAPKEIRFPYAFVSPWPGFDPVARWHGDHRGFGVVRGSSRAWNYVVVETDPAQRPERVNVSGSGQTTVTYLVSARVGRIPIVFPFTDHGLAPDPARARITRPNPCVTIVSIEVTSSNPLVPVSPPIRYSYTIYFDESRRKINYFGQHTQYPWHELWISGYGNVVADAPTNPTGTVPTPADLFLWQVPVKSDELSY